MSVEKIEDHPDLEEITLFMDKLEKIEQDIGELHCLMDRCRKNKEQEVLLRSNTGV